jgi:serine/threonine-protein kinase
MRCVNCGLLLREGDVTCPQCGGAANQPYYPAPPPGPVEQPYDLVPGTATTPRRGGGAKPALIVGLVLLAAIAGVGIAVGVARHSAAAPQPDAAGPAVAVTSSVARPPLAVAPPESDSPVPSSTQPPPPQSNAAAKADLDGELDQDRNAADTLVGSWIPQLSSKRPGLVADGITYDYLSIWADFQRLRTAYPTALLIWSGDYVSFKSPDFYVTVVPQPFPDGPSANQWCDGAGLAPDDCYAKLLSHDGGSSNTTLLRQ